MSEVVVDANVVRFARHYLAMEADGLTWAAPNSDVRILAREIIRLSDLTSTPMRETQSDT